MAKKKDDEPEVAHVCNSCGYECDCGDDEMCDECSICHAAGTCSCQPKDIAAVSEK